MHLKRWITSIIGIPILVVIISKGGPLVFTLFIALVMAVSLWEYYFIVFSGNARNIVSPIALWGMGMGVVILVAAHFRSYSLILALLTINLMAAGVLSMQRFKDTPGILTCVAYEVMGTVYIPVSLSMIVWLRQGPDGPAWVFFLLFIVFGGDVGAFYTGTYLGRRKLCPAISPKKTYEGAGGSLLTSMAIGYGFKYIFLPHLDPWLCLGSILMTNAAAQAGDLFESQLKRAADIKDSGTILPGHGGLLDRIDALLFAAPVMFLCKEWIMC